MSICIPLQWWPRNTKRNERNENLRFHQMLSFSHSCVCACVDMLPLSVHSRNLLHTHKCEALDLSLFISWCISSFHSRPNTPSFAHPRTLTIIRPTLPSSPPPPPPPYLQDLSSLFLPCWLTSPRPEECLTLGSGWIRAVLAPQHAQLFLMSSSRSGLWAS